MHIYSLVVPICLLIAILETAIACLHVYWRLHTVMIQSLEEHADLHLCCSQMANAPVFSSVIFVCFSGMLFISVSITNSM